MHDAESMDLISRLAWTRRLAAELVNDAGLVEDLVQDAWVRFLTRPPRATGSWNAWFARVLRNLAAQHWRRTRRGGELERDAHEDRTDGSTAEVVARAQTQRALVEAVLSLKQP